MPVSTERIGRARRKAERAIIVPDRRPHALRKIIVGGKTEVWSKSQTLFPDPLEELGLDRLFDAKNAKSLDPIGDCRRNWLRAESVGVGLDDRHHRNAGHGSNFLHVSADSIQINADSHMRAERHANIQLARTGFVQFPVFRGVRLGGRVVGVVAISNNASAKADPTRFIAGTWQLVSRDAQQSAWRHLRMDFPVRAFFRLLAAWNLREKGVSSPDAGSEVLRRAGSSVEESGSSEYLRTGVISQHSSHATAKETSTRYQNTKRSKPGAPLRVAANQMPEEFLFHTIRQRRRLDGGFACRCIDPFNHAKLMQCRLFAGGVGENFH